MIQPLSIASAVSALRGLEAADAHRRSLLRPAFERRLVAWRQGAAARSYGLAVGAQQLCLKGVTLATVVGERHHRAEQGPNVHLDLACSGLGCSIDFPRLHGLAVVDREQPCLSRL